MKIKDILSLPQSKKIGNQKIAAIADDSRSCPQNSLFFIIKRPHFDIFSVLAQIEKKVKVYVADKKDKKEVEKKVKNKPVIYVGQVENYFYQAVKFFYKPAKRIEIIGVTGTNGKTSTAYFFYQLMKKMEKKVAFFGTLGYFFGSSWRKSSHTTADLLTLYRLINQASKRGIDYLVLEVSSHGIAQARIKGIKFSLCIFTNLSRDHLDYHKNMQTYFQVKKSFFTVNKKADLIINKDCFYGRKILNSLNKKISYGIKNKSDYQAKNIKLTKEGIKFDLAWQTKVFPFSLKIGGYHNILNILGALAAVHSLNFSLPRLAKIAPSLKNPPGRFEKIYQNIFVDYAHTPEGLKFILFSLRQMGYEIIISLFGCGGQRDKGKRKTMGKISSQLADFTIITSDNPRGENPLDICLQIKEGILNDKFKVIIDRKQAITKGIELYFALKEKAPQKVSLLVAGRGHEDYQLIKGKKIKFKDSQVIKNIIKNENYQL